VYSTQQTSINNPVNAPPGMAVHNRFMPKKAKSGNNENPTHEQAVGKRMKLAIAAAGLTPKDLADQLTETGAFGTITPQRVNGWINEGKKPHGWELVGAIAKICDVPLDWLITGDSHYVHNFTMNKIRALYPEWVGHEPIFGHIRIE
jgi:transcriptional regulator with XRE-family HTH domain